MNTLPLALNYGSGIRAPKDAGVRYEPQGLVEEAEPKVSSVPSPLGALQTELQRIFPEKREETRVQVARRIMGEAVIKLSDEELDAYLTEFQFLINAWMDGYEKQLFEGKTLEQLLKEG
jgi:hypothetical protein